MKYDKEFDVWASFCFPEPCGIGITNYAAEQIGEIAYINFAVKPGDKVERGDVLAYIESPKTCAEVKAPFAGTVDVVFDNSIGEMCQQMNENAEEVMLLAVCPDEKADINKMLYEEEYLEEKK
jgi:glycine cleavage system H lipoate-binding protein